VPTFIARALILFEIYGGGGTPPGSETKKKKPRQNRVRIQRIYGNFFPNLSSIISENAWMPPNFFFDSDSPCLDLPFSHSHKPRKNFFVLVGKFLKRL